ncbi:hypothetical protein EIP91_010966 [Steccherinum ochraceum]|uniref:DUF7918 domain-containing protein n=1 Tax=Steccherinum ochraceum TaxID=92696 RepID=A0A4R0RWG6_9APHY|nr:hypothetical protein EIP91_010966 [Steccherinum ochraceum]
MPKVGEFSVHIVVDGKEVEEYGEEVLGDRSVSCYIPSVTDQSFCIKLSSNLAEEVSFATFLDGRHVHGHLCASSRTQTVQGINVDATTYRPLKFGRLDVTDDDDAFRDKSLWNDIGCIELRIRRFDQNSKVLANISDDTSIFKSRPVHERSKKAGTHRVAMGQEQVRAPVTSVIVQYIDTLDAPFASFKFMYRPPAVLQAQGIMPLSSAAKRKRGDGDEGDEDGDESEDHAANKALAEKEKRIQALLDEAEKMKAEVDAERGLVRVKREPSPIRIASSSSSRKRVFIDLTDD